MFGRDTKSVEQLYEKQKEKEMLEEKISEEKIPEEKMAGENLSGEGKIKMPLFILLSFGIDKI